MTDPGTSYARRDELRAVAHDRITQIYKLLLLLLPLFLLALLSVGGIIFQIGDHARRLDLVEGGVAAQDLRLRVQENGAAVSAEKLSAIAATLKRIDDRLELRDRSQRRADEPVEDDR